ncbi:MAG: EFR1 family ferrodoxin [Clostridiales bacterium]|jgi:ferredoxin|nr:EFR1 family ferrodoxin [Clostridiales bacterium]
MQQETTKEILNNGVQRNLILYFSGTGNCYSIAKRLAEISGGAKTVRITPQLVEEAEKGGKSFAAQKVIIVFPAYAYGMPPVMYGFFKRVAIISPYIAVIVSHGTKYGAALSQTKRQARKCGTDIKGYFDIKSVENFAPIFGLPSDAEIKIQTEEQYNQTEIIAEKIKENTLNKVKRGFYLPYGFVSGIFRLFRPLLNCSFIISDKCVKCGLCAKKCPAAALVFTSGEKPKLKRRKCQCCQGCINVCPKQAITFAGMRKSRRRYLHPDFQQAAGSLSDKSNGSDTETEADNS